MPAPGRDPRYRIAADRGVAPDPVPLSPFDPGFRAVVNQGPIEAEYEARNHDPTTWTPIPWGLVLVGLVMGLLSIYVSVHAVLRFGFAIGVAYYLSYFIGIFARWSPGVINYVAGASTGASQVVLGAAYVVPAMFRLTTGDDPLYALSDLPSLWGLTGFIVVGGLFGVLFFQFYRHLWLVARPLPYPGGFDASLGLLSIAHDSQEGDRRAAGRALLLVLAGAILSAVVVLLRDLRIRGDALLDRWFAGPYYLEGNIPDIWIHRPFYNGLVFLSPFSVAVGWFIGLRVAGILFAGTLFMHLLPFVIEEARGDAVSLVALWSSTSRTLAAGAITGAGLTALVRLRATIWQGVGDLIRSSSVESGERGARPHLVPGAAIAWGLGGGSVLAVLALWWGGVPLGAVVLLLVVATLLVAILGLVGTKVTGETALQAVSPLTLVALLVLLGFFMLLGFDGPTLIVMGLSGAAFFATGLVMSTDIMLDFKIAHYIGNPPRRQALMQLVGLVPGVLLGTWLVWDLSGSIADGTLTGYSVPLGEVFARITQAITGGSLWWTGFLVAAGLGAAVEWWTGRGTVFGVGMALGMGIAFPLFVGAVLRHLYARRHGMATGIGGLAAVALPTGVFVGDAVATGVVFALNQWIL